jgi:hypothetical protein
MLPNEACLWHINDNALRGARREMDDHVSKSTRGTLDRWVAEPSNLIAQPIRRDGRPMWASLSLVNRFLVVESDDEDAAFSVCETDCGVHGQLPQLSFAGSPPLYLEIPSL